MNIKDYKCIVVLFAPELGGNHFANILSTSPHVEKRANVKNYEKFLDDYYSSCLANAHIKSDISNVGITNIEGAYNTVMQATKTYVIAGHINETYFVYQQKLKEFDPIGFINFENLSLNDAAHKRLGNMNGPYHGLIRWLYRDDIICKLFETKQQNIFTINTSELFEPDITKLLTRLNQDLGLDLDLDFCIRLHNKWYKKIIQ